MGKIYDGEIKLNMVQVCDKLRNTIQPSQASVLAKYITKGQNKKQVFAHAVLDAYKELPNETEHDMEVRKLCKHLMEKYMKSTSTMNDEQSAFGILVDDITSK